MIKAIIFDCFGVLAASSLEPFYKTFFNCDPEKVAEAQALDQQATRGELQYEAFVSKLAVLAGITIKEATTFLEKNPADDELLHFIRDELRPTYKIGLLSNAADDWLEELFTTEQLELFDDFVLSFRHGISKPDTAIYELAAERLGVEPAACVFIDDSPTYCDGAVRAGMRALHYDGFVSFKGRLTEMLNTAGS